MRYMCNQISHSKFIFSWYPGKFLVVFGNINFRIFLAYVCQKGFLFSMFTICNKMKLLRIISSLDMFKF
jgi:hypothetical protein